jgi:serine/threonine protein kinase HipA of HipAB toxin-antitoxin module
MLVMAVTALMAAGGISAHEDRSREREGKTKAQRQTKKEKKTQMSGIYRRRRSKTEQDERLSQKPVLKTNLALTASCGCLV